MKWMRFSAIWTNSAGWLRPGFVQIDDRGIIQLLSGQAPVGTPVESVQGYACPGFVNSHSHAFQIAMAGVAEHVSAKNAHDDFWSWREAMYDLALRLEPEDVERVAAYAYQEFLCAGFTSVVEFHYLHHDPQGNRYGNLAELTERHMIAALRTGIRLTIIPVYYNQSDFGVAAKPRQRRFILRDETEYQNLLAASAQGMRQANQSIQGLVRLGSGVHSLRAATTRDLLAIFRSRDPQQAFHIHAAEQRREVAACQSYLNARPVEWLLRNLALDRNCSLVHATHTSGAELSELVKTGANVVLCPSTEGNLGDGFFSFGHFHRSGGAWAIGTDSHVGLNPLEELRWLDYGQRLNEEKRHSFLQRAGENCGEELFCRSQVGGAQSAAVDAAPAFAPGMNWDAVVYDSPLLDATSTQNLFATLIYTLDRRAIRNVYVAGRLLVERGEHRQSISILRDFESAMRRLQVR